MDYETYSDLKKKLTDRTITGFWALYDNTALSIEFDDGSKFYVYAKMNPVDDDAELFVQVVSPRQVEAQQQQAEATNGPANNTERERTE